MSRRDCKADAMEQWIFITPREQLLQYTLWWLSEPPEMGTSGESITCDVRNIEKHKSGDKLKHLTMCFSLPDEIPNVCDILNDGT